MVLLEENPLPKFASTFSGISQSVAVISDQWESTRIIMAEIEKAIQAENARRDAEVQVAQLAEEARRAEEAQRAEEARIAEEARRAEETRKAEAAQRAKKARQRTKAPKVEKARQSEPKMAPKTNEEMNLFCTRCNREFRNRFNLRRHEFKNACEKELSTDTKKKNSKKMEKLHNRSDADASEIKRYPCDKCEAVFNYGYLLDKHVNTVHDPEREIFPCDKCRKTFVWEKSLKKHLMLSHKPSAVQRTQLEVLM